MENIENLLQNVEMLRKKTEEHNLEALKNGERFDVFSVVGLWDDEVKLHSAIIAELLDPNGSHGAGDNYLKLFLNLLNSDDFPLNANLVKDRMCKKITERTIGPKSEVSGGRIDIIIDDGNNALIIENKPGYKDEYHQLLRYHNYANTYDNSILVYLTKDGRKASEYSTGGEKFEYVCLSYADILVWLEECSNISLNRYNVKSIINQYKYHINLLLGQSMNEKNTEKLLDILIDKNNVLAVREILNIRDRWFNAIIEKYLFEPLKEYASSKNMKCHYSCESGELGFYMYKESWKYYGIFLWTNKSCWADLCVGVSWYNTPNRTNKLFKKDYVNMDCLNQDACEEWPYGWEYLPSDIRNLGYHNADKIINNQVLECVRQKFEDIFNEIEACNLRIP